MSISNHQKSFGTPKMRAAMICGVLIILNAACSQNVDQPTASTHASDLISAATAEGQLTVYSVLSNRAAQPLIDDFEALYPGIDVSYDGDSGSNEIDARFRSELSTTGKTADVMWSSAMDLQMQLVKEGNAAAYASPESTGMPANAVFEDQAFGTTLEPVVFVYNTELLAAPDIPQDHTAFGDLVSKDIARFGGKVTNFDIEKSGVGYMLAVRDQVENQDIAKLRSQLACADVRTSSGTGAMLTSVNSGEFLLGYNVMGAYALSRSKSDLPNLGVVYPSDYTIALSRVMFINKAAEHPNAARLWLDYVLSARGQAVLADGLNLYPVKSGIPARQSREVLLERTGPGLRPIPVDMSLAEALEPTSRQTLLQSWQPFLSSGCTTTSTE